MGVGTPKSGLLLVPLEPLGDQAGDADDPDHHEFFTRDQRRKQRLEEPHLPGQAACHQGRDAVGGHPVRGAVEIGIAVAFREFHIAKEGRGMLAHLGQQGNRSDRVEFQNPAPPENADAVVEGMRWIAAKGEFLGPVDLVGGGIVMRRFGPPDQFDGFVPVFDPLFAAL